MSKHPVTLTDRVRILTGRFMDPLGRFLASWGVHPDLVTILGLVVVLIAALFIGNGEFQIGGLVLLLGLPLDAVDGAVARAMQRKDKFGAMLDSSLDRYADGLIFAALSYHFAMQGRFDLLVLAQAALLGSFMVSYARARGEGVDVIVKVGWFTRMERVVLILLILLLPPTLEIGLWVLAIGTNLTGLQRIWYVYKTLREREGQKEIKKGEN
jgi:CDP-diacylglycerol---glycerol-3-phosphate 3-phosphatidyltransferase